MKRGQEKEWQRDPSNLDTSKVQVWSCTGILLTANTSLEDARTLVNQGRAFVMCDQAIGFFEEGGE